MILSRQRLFQLVFLVVAILSLDVLTKYLVHEHVSHRMWALPMYPYGGIPVCKNLLGIDLVISHVTNEGGPWGVVSSHHTSLVLFRVFAIGCLIAHLLFFNKIPFREVPLAMIIAGAVGNVLDSFFYGHVIDMIHCVFWGYSFPVFNIADMTICSGVAVMLIHACVQKWKERRPKPVAPVNSSAPMYQEDPFSFDKIDHHGP